LVIDSVERPTESTATPVGETFDYAGTHYALGDCPALPKPVQRPHPPIIIGGLGAKRTPALAATFADEFNVPFATLEAVRTQYQRVADAVDSVGRSTESMTYSAAFVLCAGRDDAELTRRAGAIGRDLEEMRSNSPVVGTPPQIVDRLGPFASAGVQRVYLQALDLADLDHLELFAAEVIRQL
jgi:alkanesulfonate monooxygenase SsuD/methylene tetrahydromethanopterin reductase-like flavin-dependent oxidoreductase (luciferase family)